MRKFALLLLVLIPASVFTQEKIDISGAFEWETLLIQSTITLDLASAGIKLPTGRTRAETILADSYSRLIRPVILDLQVDSSSTIADLVERGDFSLVDVDAISHFAFTVPPSLTPDMLSMSASYVIPVNTAGIALPRHSRPSPVIRTLNPVSAARYTGIIIIASEPLPAHGLKSKQLPVPCLFPKIWDSEMNLIYERSMLESRVSMARYSSRQNILYNSPSGLSPELREVAGERPLRIFARGVFGINPTDLIIDRSDALLIISNEENRRLLSQGKVAIILDDSVLKREF